MTDELMYLRMRMMVESRDARELAQLSQISAALDVNNSEYIKIVVSRDAALNYVHSCALTDNARWDYERKTE